MLIAAKAAITTVLILTATGATIGLTTHGNEGDEAVTLDQVPVPVRVTILSHLDGGTITELERTTDHGRLLYEVDVRTATGKVEFDVAEDGTFVGYDNDADDDAQDGDDDADDGDEDDGDVAVTLDQVPDAVRETILTNAHGGRIIELERTTDHGRVLYEVDVLTEFDVAEDGAFVGYDNDGDDDADDEGDEGEHDMKISLDKVPAAVRAAIFANLQGGTIDEIELSTEDGVTVYEIEVEHADHSDTEFAVDGNGKFLGFEADDEGEADDGDGDGEADDD